LYQDVIIAVFISEINTGKKFGEVQYYRYILYIWCNYTDVFLNKQNVLITITTEIYIELIYFSV